MMLRSSSRGLLSNRSWRWTATVAMIPLLFLSLSAAWAQDDDLLPPPLPGGEQGLTAPDQPPSVLDTDPSPEGDLQIRAPKEDLTPAMDVDTSFAMPSAGRSTAARGGLSFGGARPGRYTVVKGDTLWHISARFWGDPYFWPTLWSYNPSIGNAHFIYPEDVLYFTLGSAVRPPGMAMDGQPNSPDQVSTGGNSPPLFLDPQAAVTASGASNALQCSVPLAFRPDREGDELKSTMTSFLVDESFSAVGKLVRSPQAAEYLGTRDLVYLSFSRLSEVSCGDVYTLYRPIRDKVRHPEHFFRKLGHMYAITGEVRIIDLNDHVATAEVVQAYEEVLRGDLVSEFIPVKKTVQVRSATKELDGTIVAAKRPTQESLTTRDIIFIDRGDADGVSAGDTFFVTRRGDGYLEAGRRDSNLPDRVVGQIVVIDAGESISTAVITRATDGLLIGDRISMQVF